MRKSLITKVSARGQLSVPVDVRDAIGLKAGSLANWELLEDGSARVSVVKQTSEKGARDLLGFAKTFRRTRRSDDWFK